MNPEYSLEGLMLKLKLQYFGHLMRRTDSLEKTLMLGKVEGRRRRGRQRMRWLDGIADAMYMSQQILGESQGQGSLVRCSPWGPKESDMTEWLNTPFSTDSYTIQIFPFFFLGPQHFQDLLSITAVFCFLRDTYLRIIQLNVSLMNYQCSIVSTIAPTHDCKISIPIIFASVLREIWEDRLYD